jgi:hypothetical protein
MTVRRTEMVKREASRKGLFAVGAPARTRVLFIWV